jgi:hypothetical protein
MELHDFYSFEGITSLRTPGADVLRVRPDDVSLNSDDRLIRRKYRRLLTTLVEYDMIYFIRPHLESSLAGRA